MCLTNVVRCYWPAQQIAMLSSRKMLHLIVIWLVLLHLRVDGEIIKTFGISVAVKMRQTFYHHFYRWDSFNCFQLSIISPWTVGWFKIRSIYSCVLSRVVGKATTCIKWNRFFAVNLTFSNALIKSIAEFGVVMNAFDEVNYLIIPIDAFKNQSNFKFSFTWQSLSIPSRTKSSIFVWFSAKASYFNQIICG